MPNPTVSVIVPCYNSEKTVAETLNSLILQKFHDWEAIVVNDGSTDNSLEIIRKFASQDKRIHFIDQENKGLAGARNAGIQIAKGEFLNFLDADDLLLPKMLEKMVKKLRRNSDLGAVHCGCVISDYHLQDWNWIHAPIYEGQVFDKLTLFNLSPVHSILLHREILYDIGGFDVSLKHVQDWDFWIRVARKGTRFGQVQNVLAVYRMVPQSLSHRTKNYLKASLAVVETAFGPDGRVRDPDPKFAQGGDLSKKETVKMNCALYCCSRAIALQDVSLAQEIFDRALLDFKVIPSAQQCAATMNWGLWFGAGFTRRQWEALYSKIGSALVRFLCHVEKQLNSPGFSMEYIKEFYSTQVDEYNGQDILRRLLRRMKAIFFIGHESRLKRARRNMRRLLSNEKVLARAKLVPYCKDPRVSIIIACFNGASTIDQTLQSLLLQTFKNWEAIVVDDGSLDSSPMVIGRYVAKDARIQYVRQDNQGVAGARNTALKLVRGEYLVFLDQDDLFLPKMLERLIKKFQENPGLSAVSCDYVITDAKLEKWNWVGCFPKEGKVFRELVKFDRFHVNSVLFRRSILRTAGAALDVNASSLEDWDLWLRIARTGALFGHVHEPLTLCRMLPTSLTHRVRVYRQAGLRVIDHAFLPDQRVINSDPDFAQGGDFDEKKSVVINWLLCCCALALVAHDEDFAYEIFEDLMIRCGRGPTLDELLAAFEWGLWFGIAAPPGEWKQLIPKVSLPLMLFLAKIEERTLSPGLTLKFTSLFFSRHRELWGKELLRLLFRRSWKKYLNGDKQNRMQTLGMRFLKMLQD